MVEIGKFGQHCTLYTAPRSSGYFVRKRLWRRSSGYFAKFVRKRLWSYKGRHRAARAAKKSVIFKTKL